MADLREYTPLRDSDRLITPTLVAGVLGWTLDAFDYFILVFTLPAVAKEFGRSDADIAYTFFVTLAMRPVGAAIFGWLADRYGRRLPLMADLIFYSLAELLSGLAPNYTTFLWMRALYGIGMGGEWGVGASLVMEEAPASRRGALSGLLQEGYALGYMLAAGAYFVVFPRFGWRAMFVLGASPALLALYVRARVPESRAWKQTRPNSREIFGALRSNLALLTYLIVLMTILGLMAHGTQDMYPTFLERERGLSARSVALIGLVYNLGALTGGICIGFLSDRWGRKRAMAGATFIGLLLVPAWTHAQSPITIALAALAMQFMVQGVWGVIPAHLTELSPPAVRGLLPGVAYQLGMALAGTGPYIEALIAARMDYEHALRLVAATVLISGVIAIALGRERSGHDFLAPAPAD